MEGRTVSGSLILGLVNRLAAPNETAEPGGALDAEKLAAILGAARVAPSADNAQTWRFITVQEHTARERLGQSVVDQSVAGQLAASNTIVALCGISWVVTRARREQPFVFMDVPIALTHILLQAAELNVSCCWTLDVNEDQVRAVLAIPSSVRVVALIGLS